jgi:hypothetical protein
MAHTTKGHILNPAQAKHVYDAMVTLNNISGVIHARVPAGFGHIVTVHQEIMSDDVVVRQYMRGRGPDGEDELTLVETFADQNAFAEAYGVA